jgi:diacylglycerol kinase (ATP)
MAVVLIINPVSGSCRLSPQERGNARASLARRVLERAGVAHRIELTQHPRHAEALTRTAVDEGAELVIAWGGDGTVNEVASVLAFSSVPLGIVPGGSGNGLARELGISLKPERALHRALQGRDRAIDVGQLGPRLFFNLAGVGFDAHVARRFNDLGRRRGFAAYIGTSLVELLRYRPLRYAIRFEQETIDRHALMVVLANGSQYGNGARVAPDARPDDGELDLVVIEPRSPLANAWRSRHLFDGTLARRPGVIVRRVRQLSIENGPAPVGFHVDGEPSEMHGPLEGKVHPHGLLVRV